MKRVTLGLSALALVLAGAGFAGAQMHAAQPETRAEAQTRAGQLFDRLDLNHDGKLDQADRALRMNQVFDRVDTNHDGTISRDEFSAMHAHGMEHAMADHPGGGSGDGHMGHWGYGHRELRGLVMLIMYRADPGHTGTISRAAFVGAALSLFDQADSNHDGVLTPDEHHAAAEAMRQHMQGGWHPGAEGGNMPPPPPGAPPQGN